MSVWNYRLVEEQGFLHLVEAYYDAAGRLDSWCHASPPMGETLKEFEGDCNAQAAAGARPIIKASDLPGGWEDPQ